MEISIPEGAGPFPPAVLVHGGGWVRGTPRDIAPVAQALSEAGFACFSISYRLAANPLQFGDAVQDVEAAVRFVASHAAEYRIDPTRMALIGESAGGQLAAMATLRLKSCVRAVVAISVPADLIALARNSGFIPQALRQSLEGAPWAGMIMQRIERLSPMHNIRRDMPPFLLIHGTADPLIPFLQAVEMCSRMREAGAKCDLFPVEGAGHGIRWWESNPAFAAPYKREIVRWLRESVTTSPRHNHAAKQSTN
jgi:acetyl esterase